MKMNVYVALLGSASALKLKQTGVAATNGTYTPPAMLHKSCATYPTTWSPPATLDCDYKEGYYMDYVVAGTSCDYDCNRQLVCTVDNGCLPQPMLHETCTTGFPDTWSPPSSLKCPAG